MDAGVTASMKRNRAQNWLPLRFSLRALLLLTTALCLIMGWRLQPLLAARQFTRQLESVSPTAALSVLSDEDEQRVLQHIQQRHDPRWVVHFEDDVWDTMGTGTATVRVLLKWSDFSVYGADTLTLEFKPFRNPTAAIEETERELASITIL